jgi:hypothetical protein
MGEFTKMNEHCPVCGQVTEIEVGFYYGTGYVSYALTVAFSVATFIAWWVFIGISIYDKIEESQRRCCSMCYLIYQIMKTMLKI